MHRLAKYLNIKVENYNLFLRIVSLLLAAIHIFLMLCFRQLEVDVLTYVNIVSICIYVCCFIITFKGTYPLIMFSVITFEVLAYSTLAVIYVGEKGYFYLYSIALYAFLFLTKYVCDLSRISQNKKNCNPVIYTWFAIITIFFVLQEWFLSWMEPVIQINNSALVYFMKMINLAVIVGCVWIACGVLVKVANQYARESVSNIEEMEHLVVETEKANEIKSEFLANMSHEIRTPMNAICGMADLLGDESLSEEAVDYVNTIKTAGQHLLSIINDILDFSKIEAGKLNIVEDKYLYNDMVREIINIMSTRIEDKPIVIIEDIDDNIPGIMIGDVGRIRQIIINIMNNAVKFTDAGTITIKSYFVKSEKSTEDNIIGNLHFEIKDTGRGIKQEDIGKLFNAFEQVDKKKNSGIEGTGLGLSICKMLVNGMQGKIFVESEYEKGSCFHFYIKQKVSNYKPCNYSRNKHSKKINKKDSYFKTKDVKVLVVDDNRVNLKVAAGMLNRYGITPYEVNCGQDAIEVLRKDTDFDIVFMDHLMPIMDGIEATKLIRKLDEYKDKKLVIIALSANAVNGMEEKFLEVGMDDFLAKPIETDNLTSILKKWIPKEKIIR